MNVQVNPKFEYCSYDFVPYYPEKSVGAISQTKILGNRIFRSVGFPIETVACTVSVSAAPSGKKNDTLNQTLLCHTLLLSLITHLSYEPIRVFLV